MIRSVLLFAIAGNAMGFAPLPLSQSTLRSHPRAAACGIVSMSAESQAHKGPALALALLLAVGGGAMDASAVSGGVADFSDVAGQDFSGQNLKGKDFSSAVARDTKFVGANLKGAKFFKADLQDADFTDANLSNASIENAKLSGVKLTNAILKNAYTGVGLELVKDFTNSDFTGAQLRPDVQSKICAREDVKGTNPKTKADTRESLECP